MSLHPIRNVTDDRTIDMLRRLALRTATHVVMVSKGNLLGDDAADLRIAIPADTAAQLRDGIDAIEQINDLLTADNLFTACASAVGQFADRAGTGVHAIIARRDGTVDLALPRAGVSRIRTALFPGFEDIAA